MKYKFMFFKLKEMLIPFCLLVFIILLLIFANANLSSAKNGLILWANSMIPSLLPFFIATELLNYTYIVSFFSKLLNNLMKPIFNVSGTGAFALLMGVISGYPIGAKIIADLKIQGKISSIEAERLIAYSNNSGPLFIVGTVGVGLFKNTSIGILLLITHILASLTVGFIFRWWKSGYKKRNYYIKEDYPILRNNSISLANLGEVLSISIMRSINSVLLIGGFIVLFSVILSVIQNSGLLNIFSKIFIPIFNTFRISPSFIKGSIFGILELTNGLFIITSIPCKLISINIVFCAFLLGFGGLCVCMQILSITSKAKISIKPYLIGKLLQGILAAVYTYLIIYYIPIFNLNL